MHSGAVATRPDALDDLPSRPYSGRDDSVFPDDLMAMTKMASVGLG